MQALSAGSASRGLVDGRSVLFSALSEAAVAEDDLTIAEWSDLHRKISPESGSRYPGDWVTDRVPYLREPMDCLHPDHPARSVRLKFSAQTGKSEIGVCWFGYIVDQAPGSILTVLPSLDEVLKYNKVKLQPTIDASPRIRQRVRRENSRDEAASTMAFKRFAGGFDLITTASSSKGLQMISVRYLIMEEVSEYPLDTDGRGSPIDQARARQKSFGSLAKEFVPSTPGIAGECRISEMYEDGDRRRCYLPCPRCGVFQTLRIENMQEPSPATNYRVTFACAACGALIDQAAMQEMRARHRWVPTRVDDAETPIPPEIEPDRIDALAVAPCAGRCRSWQPSYALWSAYSPFETWDDIWARRIAAKGDPVKEKTFTQQDLGEAYERSSETPDWEKLLAVRENWRRGTVPYPACVLTGFIDVQGNRFEWGVWAFGPGFQAWLVDRGVIGHNYETDEGWRQIDQLTARLWPTDGGRPLEVMRWGIDTGTFTQTLYDRVAGRGLLLATKSDNRPRATPFKMSRADLRDSQGNTIAGRRIDLGHVGQFDLKLSVYEGLRHLVVGKDLDGRWPQGTVHLPDWIGEDELKQLTAETLVDPRLEAKGNTKRQSLIKPGDQREWRKRPHQANEALDIAVGCRALAWGEGAGQITPERWFELVDEAHGDVPDANARLYAPPPPVERASPEAPTEDIDAALDRLGKLNSDRWQ